MSGCSNYAENLWKKGKCSNCFRSKEQHFTDSKDVFQDNGVSCLLNTSHEASKLANVKPNGLSNGERQTTREVSADREKFIQKGNVKRAGKVYQTQDFELSKRLSYQATIRCDSSSNETLNTSSLRDNKESTNSLDKSKTVFHSTREKSASKNSISLEEKESNLRCSSSTESKNSENNDIFGYPVSTDKRKDSSTNNINLDDLNQDQVTKTESKEKIVLAQSMEYENSLINQRKNTAKQDLTSITAKSSELDGKDGEYMAMNKNVCQSIKDDKKTDVQDLIDKISSSNTSESNDSNGIRIINNDDTLSSTNKQTSVKIPNNIIEEGCDRPSDLSSESVHFSPSSSCGDQENLNNEHYYHNRRSIDSGQCSSGSSTTSLERSCISSVVSPDRPDSLAFKIQSDLGELRESSIFEDIVVESSKTTFNSRETSKTNSSISNSAIADPINRRYSESGGKVEDNSDTFGKMPFDSHPRLSKQEQSTPRRYSNPDVTKLVEGPCYANADAKPMTKPYKVVDISAGLPVNCTVDEHNDTPPLPPKEKELNKQKEDSIPDHYYCEPPDDILPDYTKLMPQCKSPPPIEIKTEQISKATTKAGPVPRPRSQLPSHSATLPRPVPRAVKVEAEVKDFNNTSRPVSQVFSRAHKKEAPKPPSTSSIPSRKYSESTSPLPPSGSHPQATATLERSRGSSNTGDNRDLTAKPKRMAPPPPKATQATACASSPKEAQPDASPIVSPTLPSQQTKPIESCPTGKSQSKSGIKRALSSWKRMSGRRKNKKKLEISSPILVTEEVENNVAQKEALVEKTPESRSGNPVCTNFKERQRESTVLSQNPSDGPPVEEKKEKEVQASSSPKLPVRKPRQSYQNFPFSKTDMERPEKPSRPAKAVKPVLQVKPEVIQSPQHEAPAYLEPCTGQLTLKVEAALANLNDAKILAETLTRVEQEKLGPLPEVPRSRHVHFRFNETANEVNNASVKNAKQSPQRPVTAVAPTVVNKQTETKCRQPKYPSRPPNTKLFASDEKKRSRNLTEMKDSKPGNESPRSSSMSIQGNSVKKRYDKILELHRQTLQDVIKSSKAVLLPGDGIDLSNTRWQDYVTCGRALDMEAPGAVLLPVMCTNIDEELTLLAKVKFPKSVTEDMSERTAFMQDMAITVSLPTHPNVSRTITHFTDYLPAEVFGLKNSSDFETLVTITDQVPIESVLEFVERTVEEHAELPDEYERKICILLIQLLSALVHLHNEGIVHRDIRLNNIVLLDHGHLVLTNFSHILQNSGGEVSTSRFDYSIDSVGHIGRDPCRIPPEIHKSYNCGKTMNYEKCDVFAVGCLIYELLHERNPFAVESSLLTRDYSIHDLPMLTEKSRFTIGLGALASGLLQRDPSMRMLPEEALKLLQAFLWGPEDLDESCIESSASDWLETERAHAVILIARNQSQGSLVGGDEFLENFLKYQYLVTLTEENVIDGYSALAPQESPTLGATV